MRLNLLAVAAVPALLSAASFGAVVNHTGLVRNGLVDFVSGETGSFSVPKFDGSLGTLTKVELIITGHSYGGVVTYESLSVQPVAVDIDVVTKIKVTGPGSLLVISTPQQNTTFNAAAYDGATDYAGTSGTTLTGAAASDQKSDSMSLPADLSGFYGPGSFVYNFTSSMSAAISGSSYSSTATDTNFNFNYEVIYTYDTVPEAASLSVLGLGGAALMARRRK